MPTIEVFIENEAGTTTKHHYDERTLVLQRTEQVHAAYPWPYGFVPGTVAPDGDAADCFVITDRGFPTGTTVACEPIALMEQTEGGAVDHNVIAVLPGDPHPDLGPVVAAITDFGTRAFAGMPGREIEAGRLLPAAAALAYLEDCARAFRDAGA